MSIRSNGSYIGPRPTGPSDTVASGIWDLRTVEREMRNAQWPVLFGGPLEVSGLALWLDASDSATLFDATSGGSLVVADGGVARWEDKSGNSRHFTQSTAENRPQRKTSQINGLDAILYDGSNDILTRSNEAWAFTFPVTFFVVFRAVSFDSSYNSLWDFYTTTTTSFAGHTGLIKSNGKSAIYALDSAGGSPNYDGNGAITYSTATNYVFNAVVDDGSFASRGNGATDGSYAAAFTLRTNRSTGPLQVGASSPFSRYTNWAIGEVAVYSGVSLSTSDRDAIENYLMTKWGAT